jgi:RNA polymerase sigma-70 factor (ECF subfamily)
MSNKAEINHKLDLFFRECQKQAYSIVYINIKKKSDSLDVIQNTMIAFVKHYKLKPESQWRPLFFKVLQNKINDHFRANKKWMHLFVSQSEEDRQEKNKQLKIAEKETPIKNFEANEIYKKVSQAISGLPERQKQVVIYRLWQGFSVYETANIMKVSQGSIKTHLSRALTNLKGQLGELYEAY